MSKKSGTDWKRLARMTDSDIDYSDVPKLDDAFFEQAELHVPLKQPITMRLDADVTE